MNSVREGAWRHAHDGRPCLYLGEAGDIDAEFAPPTDLAIGASVLIDGSALRTWDAALATRIFALTDDLHRRGIVTDFSGLPAGLSGLLQLASRDEPVRPDPQSDRPQQSAIALMRTSPPPMVRTVTLIGGVLLAAGRRLRGRGVPIARELLRQLDQAGPGSLGIVVLTCGLVGLMLAYMGGAQLERMGAQGFLADVVTVGMVRELAGLMTGIVLAGRVGSAFAAQLASMQAGEEIDALVVLGVDPIQHLVLPRLLALLLAAPALLAFGALAGVLAGWPAAVGSYGLSTVEYFAQCKRALTFTHVWIGLFKGVLYAVLVGLAGCREGLYAGRSAQDMGRAATAAVVRALVWVIGAACLSTVVFTSLGY